MLSIVKETKHWLIINKRSGMIVEQNPYESSVEDLVRTYLSQKYSNPFVGIIHRLDRVTSGALIVAKRKSALRRLNEQFRLGAVQKTYLAVVLKVPPKKRDLLQHYLVKKERKKRSEVFERPVEKGKLVSLEYELIGQVNDLFLLKIKPKTGKFHQIRAQLAAIDCPIIGDEKYGSTQKYEDLKIGLHAYELCFDYPENEIWKAEKCVANLPKDELWNNFLLPNWH
ncbi:MAG: RNA pseudouridine synthase [Bacteroidota bacterium]